MTNVADSEAPVSEVAGTSTDSEAPEPQSVEEAAEDWGGLVDQFEADPNEDPPAEPIAESQPESTAETPSAETPPAVEPEPVTTEPEPVVAEVPPVEVPPVVPEVVPTPEVVPDPAPEPVPVAEVTPEPVPDPPAPLTTEQMSEMREKYITELIPQYAMTAEQGVEVLSSPNESLPRLFAQAHAQILEHTVQSVTQTVMQLLPGYLENFTSTRETSRTNEQQFYDRFPELKEHRTKVVEVGNLYRQVAPQATLEQFITNVGGQVWLAQGLDLADLAARMQPANPAPAAVPAAPAPAGLNPDTGGTPPATGVKPAVTNPFDALTAEIEDEASRTEQ